MVRSSRIASAEEIAAVAAAARELFVAVPCVRVSIAMDEEDERELAAHCEKLATTIVQHGTPYVIVGRSFPAPSGSDPAPLIAEAASLLRLDPCVARRARKTPRKRVEELSARVEEAVAVLRRLGRLAAVQAAFHVDRDGFECGGQHADSAHAFFIALAWRIELELVDSAGEATCDRVWNAVPVAVANPDGTSRPPARSWADDLFDSRVLRALEWEEREALRRAPQATPAPLDAKVLERLLVAHLPPAPQSSDDRWHLRDLTMRMAMAEHPLSQRELAGVPSGSGYSGGFRDALGHALKLEFIEKCPSGGKFRCGSKLRDVLERTRRAASV